MAAETTPEDAADGGGPDDDPSNRGGQETDDSTRDGALHPAFERYEGEVVPSVGVGAPGKTGELDLSFAIADGTTRLVRDYARVPFHVSGTLGHDPHPTGETVYVQSPSGGIAQGDRHDVAVRVREGAVAHVSTSSSTKVLSMDQNYGGVDIDLHVEAGGHLEYVPEPLILHADARYCQRLAVELAPGASAIVGDVVVPGRLARGERFAFDRFAASLRALRGDRLLVADDAHLCPAERDPSAPGVLDEYDVYGTLYVLAPDLDGDAGRPTLSAFADALHAAAVEAPGGESDDDATDTVAAGATALPNDAGVLVRALGDRADGVTRSLRAAWSTARTELIGAEAPPRRKN
ncbi:urease accessory protein UreD [Halobellus clavatus]|uniref:Urease accessory protein UreD n=1 Tax=Halobellus clavatus TaxID=660517 RepID=A0A1H3EKA1_9EURY|nr:urease accessory protein UreD [Halobellus clavatus]SDX78359.1 urease accessory protein [Halobellus clavatus]